MAVFIKTAGNRNYQGTSAEYDQVDYPGALADYTFERNDNGTVTVTHPTLGTDTLTSIEGLWFQGETVWYSIDDAIATTTGGGNLPTDGNDVLIGTDGNDIFTGSLGDDNIDGNGGAYNQVDYAGALADYTFTANADGSVTVEHATRGTDRLTDIDGLWFVGETSWYSMADALAASGGSGNFPTSGDDDLVGTDGDDVFSGSFGDDTIDGNGGAYNQVDYAGALTDYTFMENTDGTVSVSHETRGIDTLTDIDGFWFIGETGWYSLADALATGPDGGTMVEGVYRGTNGDDTLEGGGSDMIFYAGRGTDVITGNGEATLYVDGEVIEWTFTENAAGTVEMSHPMWGVKTVDGIDNILFLRSLENMTISEAIAATEGLPTFRMDSDGVINGTPDDDVMVGTSESEFFYGGLGDDSYDGAGAYDQVNYDGERDEYDITQNADGSFTISHEVWGTDTVENIEGFFFSGDSEWVSADDLI